MSNLGEFREPRPPLWLEQQRVYHGVSYAYPNPYLEDDDQIPPSILRTENGPSTFGAGPASALSPPPAWSGAEAGRTPNHDPDHRPVGSHHTAPASVPSSAGGPDPSTEDTP